MCVFPLISNSVLKILSFETIVAQGIQGFANSCVENFHSEEKRTKRTFENCTKILKMFGFLFLRKIAPRSPEAPRVERRQNTKIQFGTDNAGGVAVRYG